MAAPPGLSSARSVAYRNLTRVKLPQTGHMPDYGHPLQFGTFITPYHAEPQRPVELAVLSEQLGYDLVAIQDHPYQPRFHDTWTLLSYIAARTDAHPPHSGCGEPAVPPAGGARAGGGQPRPAVRRAFRASPSARAASPRRRQAMGARVLKGGAAVQAVDEAIDVIRELWNPEKGGARVDGEFYELAGAKRGSSGAHPIPIWLGVGRPKMLRLLGRKADGWLPSLSWVGGVEGLARGNALIDEAAVEAGRDPRSIRRLLNLFGDIPLDDLVVARHSRSASPPSSPPATTPPRCSTSPRRSSPPSAPPPPGVE